MTVTAGTWNIGGINLPDFGFTEKEPASYLNPEAFVNPLQTQQSSYQAPVVLPGYSQPQVLGQDTSSPVNSSPAFIGPSYQGPQPTTPTTQTQNTGVDWSRGLTGDQVRQQGLNPDSMISSNGLFYNSNGGSTQQGPSEEELNAAYDPIFNYLNQAEQSLRGGFGGINQDIGNQYGVSANTLGSSKSQNMASLDTSGQKVQQTKEDAMSSARRLYNELIQGFGQRFGGSTSAGEAARTLM